MTHTIPRLQGLVLFEVYEATGSLLFVTSDATLIKREPGDVVIRRPWATASGYDVVRPR
jgi:hypothetical protein